MLTIDSTYHRPARTPARLMGAIAAILAATLAGLALTAAATPTAQASTAAKSAPTKPAPTAQTLVITGAGDGHGVGMSQDGALGYAQHGWTDQAILAHY